MNALAGSYGQSARRSCFVFVVWHHLVRWLPVYLCVPAQVDTTQDSPWNAIRGGQESELLRCSLGIAKNAGTMRMFPGGRDAGLACFCGGSCQNPPSGSVRSEMLPAALSRHQLGNTPSGIAVVAWCLTGLACVGMLQIRVGQ